MRAPSEAEKDYLIELVRDLVDLGFDEIFIGDNEADQLRRWRYRNAQILMEDLGVEVVNGVTRVVVVPSESKWVLKFGFQYDWFAQDYNMLEEAYYKKACDAHIEHLFAATYCLGAHYGLMVYAQEKVMVDDDRTSDSFYNYTLKTYYGNSVDEDEVYEEVLEESYELDNEDRIYAMIDTNDAERLIGFINKFNINDLHEGNWGYRGSQPVLVDYCGY